MVLLRVKSGKSWLLLDSMHGSFLSCFFLCPVMTPLKPSDLSHVL